MTKLQMFQQAIELTAIDRAPGAVEILPGLGLLSRVIVINKLIKYSLPLSIFFIPVSLLGRRSHVVRGSCVLNCQRCSKRKWRRTPWRPGQRSSWPREFELQGGAISEHLKWAHLWQEWGRGQIEHAHETISLCGWHLNNRRFKTRILISPAVWVEESKQKHKCALWLYTRNAEWDLIVK